MEPRIYQAKPMRHGLVPSASFKPRPQSRRTYDFDVVVHARGTKTRQDMTVFAVDDQEAAAKFQGMCEKLSPARVEILKVVSSLPLDQFMKSTGLDRSRNIVESQDLMQGDKLHAQLAACTTRKQRKQACLDHALEHDLSIGDLHAHMQHHYGQDYLGS